MRDDPAPVRQSNPGFRRLIPLFGRGSSEREGIFLGVFALLLAIWVIVFAPPASAHGRLGALEGRCRLFIGPDIMNFTGYLPDSSKQEFCEDIPATGHTIIVLDDVQDELRAMPVEIRIVKDIGGEQAENADLDAATVAYREPRLYPNGTINFEHVFSDPGFFVGIVTVTGVHGEKWVSRFPFSVGKSFFRTLPYYVLMALGVIVAFLIYLKHGPFSLKKVEAGPEPAG